MYHHLLKGGPPRHRNVRRAVAKALPAILPFLRASSSICHLAQHVISSLAADSDLYIRRAVVDHAMHLLSLDREFLLTLLQQMHRDTDPAIRYRLRPVALRLAEVWLVWYAQTVRLVGTVPGSRRAAKPFGEVP
jgi:3-methyladenine DNA glycosylase AlkC